MVNLTQHGIQKTLALYLHNQLYPTIPSYCTDFRQSFVLLEQGEMKRGYYPHVGRSFPIEFDPYKLRLALPGTPLPKLKSKLTIHFPGRTGDVTANLLHLLDEVKRATHSSTIKWIFSNVHVETRC